MFSTFSNMIKNKEIRKRLLFTLAMLFVYRFGMAVVVPGVSKDFLPESSGLLEMMNLLGGGGINTLSIFALGVGPYITASIIIQLLSMDVIPPLTELAKGGANGKKQLDKYTRYLAVVLGFIQASTMIYSFKSSNEGLLIRDSNATILYISIVLIAGSMFLLWIGDQISTKGIGNGVSMIIFTGIVANLWKQFQTAYTMLSTKSDSGMGSALLFGIYILSYIVIIVMVVITQRAERKIPIQYTSSTVQMTRKDMNFLPLKINSAGVIPVIFASSVMMAPLQLLNLFGKSAIAETLKPWLGMSTWRSLIIYAFLIVFFTFFYTKLQVDPEQISENLGKNGTYIPGVRPGNETKNYINKVLSRITVLGAIWLMFIALIPYVVPLLTSMDSSLGIGGTGIIIVVGVALETTTQLEGFMTQKSYRGFINR